MTMSKEASPRLRRRRREEEEEEMRTRESVSDSVYP